MTAAIIETAWVILDLAEFEASYGDPQTHFQSKYTQAVSITRVPVLAETVLNLGMVMLLRPLLAGGDEMKWRVVLEVTQADEMAVTHEISTGSRPVTETSADSIGLTLAEGKLILAACSSVSSGPRLSCFVGSGVSVNGVVPNDGSRTGAAAG